tara:strand:- start:258 stop:686 length:429 start_codon:yes stop_codon:yes gene_type:complete
MIDLNIRVNNPNVWEVKAKDLGFMEEVDVEGSMEWQFKAGINVDEIQTIWITEPTFDEDGLELTSGIKAQGQHFNIRIANPEIEALWSTLWTETLDAEGNVVSRTIAGAQAANSNKSEKAWRWQGVEFIDMTTAATPNRVWL